ncbi:MAG TPA: hypothetical protein VFB72_21200 [Verrucomicrobiae bacterium]|nr:hypothetical protein [Verrucomicrobiae bacterium]
MKLKLKEDPKEWRKSALLTALGLAVLCTVLRWRHVLPAKGWLAALITLAVVATLAVLRPRWFRGFYRISGTIGFFISQVATFIALALFFLFALTPLGIFLRLTGKDALRLKRPRDATSYWNIVEDKSSLDRPF